VQFPSSNSVSVTVANTGAPNSILSITSAPLLSGDPSFGSLTLLKGATPPPFTLTPGETATLSVTYTPSAATTLATPHTGLVSIASNDPDESPATVPVQGLARTATDLLFILDQSGSMLSQDKWNTTKWATEVVYEAARIFRIPADRAGAIWFGGPSANPQAGVLRALNPFPANPASFTAGFSQEANNLFYTPIGMGVTEAHNTFLAPTNRLNVALLMSDGIHNRPQATSGATTVAGLNLAAAVVSNQKAMRIGTVALGTASGVSAALLDNIKSHYSGGAAPMTYNITAVPAALAEVFTETLSEQLFTNRVAFNAAVTGYPIPQGADRVLAMIAWTPGNVPADIQLRIHNADGTGAPLETITTSSAGVVYHKGGGATQPFTYVLITDPARFAQNRVWKITNAGGGPIAPDVGIPIVLEDLKIIAHFTAEQPAKGTGNDYVLKARLTEVGAPITSTSAHPVQVTAHLARPGEGLGHLASTVSLQTCQASAPALPPVPSGAVTGVRGDVPLTRRAVMPAALDTSQNDPQTYLYAWASAYVANCDPDDLLVLQQPGLTLHDDGTSGDEVAGDGIYTLRFPSTEYEGSYVVRFTVVGTTPTGARFSRTRSMST
jgi:hypothetical protein